MAPENVNRATEVEIYGRSYTLVSDASPDYLLGLADLVSTKMAELEQATRTVDTTRLAILTALNLADELCKSKSLLEREQTRSQEAFNHFESVIDPVLRELPDSPA